MYDKNNKIILVFYSIFLCALSLFLYGFFPTPGYVNLTNRKGEGARPKGAVVDKLIFLVIDALRFDFVNSSTKYTMPFLQSSIANSESCLIRVMAAAPTVTMPRIKAMTSGILPNYFDIVMNLGSSEFRQDTFLRQAQLQGLRLVFYGDDTWLTMFPTLFNRSIGTHSFFAADFWEVDTNVTTALEKELARNDWDIMVAHYLGLDHIGHMEGPRSPNIATKLVEMDSVISKIQNTFENNSRSLFIVTGDHGMKDSGGHGGVTDGEVHVPVVSVGRPCVHLPGWPDPLEYNPLQIDIAPTLATVMGLPLPAGNTGKLIPALMTNTSAEEILKQLRKIKLQLLERIKGSSVEIEDNELEHTNVDRSGLEYTVAKCYEELSLLSNELSLQRGNYNLSCMIIGCLIMWTLLLSLVFLIRINAPCNFLQLFLAVGTIGYVTSLASTSFIEEEHQTWYFLWVTFLLLAFRARCQKKMKLSSYILDIKVYSFFTLCMMHRVFRKLNQTGDKWASLPDLDDYLRYNKEALLLLFLLSLVWMYALFRDAVKHNIDRVLYAICLLSIALYRLTTGNFQELVLHEIYPLSRGKFETILLYVAVALLLCRSVYYGVPSFQWVWTLLAGFTLRPHNLVLVPAQIQTSIQLFHILAPEGSTFYNSLAHVWMGHVFYFYQGNSNSLASIDIAPAFAGSDSYNLWYAALMVAVHTYAFPIQAFLFSPKESSPVLLVHLFTLTFYCTLVIFLRHHLFIWSVFSPKMLLNSTLTFVMFVIVCAHTITNILKNKRLQE